jgi:TolB-like protein
LPFTNASGDANADYLSDGISETLIDKLSQLPGLKVIARSSAFKYKGKDIDPQEVANALGVEAIPSGRVRGMGCRVILKVCCVSWKGESYPQITSISEAGVICYIRL